MPKGQKLVINPGDKYGRFTVLREESGYKKRHFFCRCECGNKKTVRLDSLRNGNIVSCGCYNKEISIKANTKHGMQKERIYRIWQAMKQRCFNKKNSHYKNYGGRGITVCEEWLSFDAFKNWAYENGYQDDLTIERIDVNGIYKPTNCTWLGSDEQKRNTTVSKKLYHDGREMTLRQWAKEVGISASTLSTRLKKGWTLEQALRTPSGGKRE